MTDSYLAGLETQTQNAAFFERKWPKRKPWHRGKSLNRKKTIAMRFLNASVLERKALNRNLSWGFPLGNILPKTRVLKHRVLERKRRPNANASVLGTQRFWDTKDSYEHVVECWINGSHGNHGNDQNYGNPGCKPWLHQATG